MLIISSLPAKRRRNLGQDSTHFKAYMSIVLVIFLRPSPIFRSLSVALEQSLIGPIFRGGKETAFTETDIEAEISWLNTVYSSIDGRKHERLVAVGS